MIDPKSRLQITLDGNQCALRHWKDDVKPHSSIYRGPGEFTSTVGHMPFAKRTGVCELCVRSSVLLRRLSLAQCCVHCRIFIWNFLAKDLKILLSADIHIAKDRRKPRPTTESLREQVDFGPIARNNRVATEYYRFFACQCQSLAINLISGKKRGALSTS